MRKGGAGVMDDQLNVPLEDAELLAEVELTTNLIIAASEADAVAAARGGRPVARGRDGTGGRPPHHPDAADPQRLTAVRPPHGPGLSLRPVDPA